MQKINQYGLLHALRISLLRQLDSSSGLHEVKIPGSTFRVFAYANSSTGSLVLVQNFTSHTGGNQIPPDTIDSMIKKANEIKENLGE
jgi:hypothetical protein